jgi:molybdopterin-guanine dinucleotide biosynthesis protein
MRLLDLVKNKYKIVSVVGMAKNAGKTVTLNELILQAEDKNINIGITSIGRDGEKQDIVTSTEKPLIYVNEGTLIATAKETFDVSEARMEILEITDFRTSLGDVVIARALSSGYVQIAGASTNLEIKKTCEKMLSYGADLVIVDGAIDRVSTASPAVTEATILATGAVISRDMDKVIEKSVHQVNLFDLNKIEDEKLKCLAEEALEKYKVCIVSESYDIHCLDIKTALSAGREIANALEEDSRYVLIKGPLVSKTLKDITTYTKLYKNVTFVVQDPTKIFIDYTDWQYYQRIEVKIAVLEKINILAVTINPYSPKGYYFDPGDFLHKMKTIIKSVPVFDVMQGGGI